MRRYEMYRLLKRLPKSIPMSELTDKEKFALLGENYIESVLGKQLSFCKTEKAEEFVQNVRRFIIGSVIAIVMGILTAILEFLL